MPAKSPDLTPAERRRLERAIAERDAAQASFRQVVADLQAEGKGPSVAKELKMSRQAVYQIAMKGSSN